VYTSSSRNFAVKRCNRRLFVDQEALYNCCVDNATREPYLHYYIALWCEAEWQPNQAISNIKCHALVQPSLLRSIGMPVEHVHEYGCLPKVWSGTCKLTLD